MVEAFWFPCLMFVWGLQLRSISDETSFTVAANCNFDLIGTRFKGGDRNLEGATGGCRDVGLSGENSRINFDVAGVFET